MVWKQWRCFHVCPWNGILCVQKVFVKLLQWSHSSGDQVVPDHMGYDNVLVGMQGRSDTSLFLPCLLLHMGCLRCMQIALKPAHADIAELANTGSAQLHHYHSIILCSVALQYGHWHAASMHSAKCRPSPAVWNIHICIVHCMLDSSPPATAYLARHIAGQAASLVSVAAVLAASLV